MNIIHHPICPNTGDEVLYTISNVLLNQSNILELYHTVYSINDDATTELITNREKLQSWRYEDVKDWNATFSSTPDFKPIECKVPEYGSSKFVQYELLFSSDGLIEQSLNVGFATRDYPVRKISEKNPSGINYPIPVYVTANVNKSVNILLIRDSQLGSDIFYDNIDKLIIDTIHTEDLLKSFTNSFNFFINKYDGIASDSNYHTCDKVENFTLMQTKVILHSKPELRDRTDWVQPKLSSTFYNYGKLDEVQKYTPSILLHEIAHTPFGLNDEYSNVNKSINMLLPATTILENDYSYMNCWYNKEKATDVAKLYGDDVEISERRKDIVFYKICNNNCLLESIEKGANYGIRCRDRIYYFLLKRLEPHLNIDTTKCIKFSQNEFQLLNLKTKNYPYETNWMFPLSLNESNQHIAVCLNKNLDIIKPSFSVRSGIFPDIEVDNDYAGLIVKDKDNIVIYKFPLPTVILTEIEEFEILLPYDNRISSIEIKNKKELILPKFFNINSTALKVIDLEIEEFKILFSNNN